VSIGRKKAKASNDGFAMLGPDVRQYPVVFLVVGEILKLVLVERLFSVSRDKLMSIPAFAWIYWKYSAAKDCITSMKAWHVALRWSLVAQHVIRSYALKLKAAQSPRLITYQSR
jgi:hypothetical protein